MTNSRPNILLIEQSLQGKVVIPDFPSFCEQIDDLYEATKLNTDGQVADYIPQLARVDPDQYGLGICTADGQSYSVGQSKT